MIDPLSTAIAWMLSNADLAALVERRIAPKHKFGIDPKAGGWRAPSAAIQLQLVEGGEPDLYVGQQNVRLIARCYGASQADAQRLWRTLQRELRVIETRFTVLTSQGLALVYWLLPDSSARADIEPDVNVDFIEFGIKAAVAEDPV